MKEFSIEDVVPDTQTVVMITKAGYISAFHPTHSRRNTVAAKGVAGLTTKEDDVVEQVFTTTTHKDLMFFTNRGRVFRLKAYDAGSLAHGQGSGDRELPSTRPWRSGHGFVLNRRHGEHEVSGSGHKSGHGQESGARSV